MHGFNINSSINDHWTISTLLRIISKQEAVVTNPFDWLYIAELWKLAEGEGIKKYKYLAK